MQHNGTGACGDMAARPASPGSSPDPTATLATGCCLGTKTANLTPVLSAYRRQLIVVLLLSLSACSEANKLHGSIGDILSLDFTRVEVRKQDQSLIIEYLRDERDQTEKVCKLTVDMRTLPTTGSFELTESGFKTGVELSRATFVPSSFPPIDSGILRITAIEFRNGGEVEGDFDVRFTDERSLLGKFSATMRETAAP